MVQQSIESSNQQRLKVPFAYITRAGLIQKLVAGQPQFAAQDIELSVRIILDGMSRALARGGRVEVRGFGSFGLNYHPARKGRNPKSGTAIMLLAKYIPHFKAGKELRERVDK